VTVLWGRGGGALDRGLGLEDEDAVGEGGTSGGSRGVDSVAGVAIVGRLRERTRITGSGASSSARRHVMIVIMRYARPCRRRGS